MQQPPQQQAQQQQAPPPSVVPLQGQVHHQQAHQQIPVQAVQPQNPMHMQQQQPQPRVPLRPVPPQGQQFHVPYWPQPPQKNSSQALGIISLVIGIISILLLCSALFFTIFPLILGIPFAIIGLVCGIVGRSKALDSTHKGIVTAGIILNAMSIVGLILGILFIFVVAGFSAGTGGIIAPEISDFLDAIEYY